MIKKASYDELISQALKSLIEEDKQILNKLTKNEIDKYFQYINRDIQILRKNAKKRRSSLSARLSKVFGELWEIHKMELFHFGEWIKRLLIVDNNINMEEFAALNDVSSENISRILEINSRTIETFSPRNLANIMEFISMNISKLLLILRNEERYFGGVISGSPDIDSKSTRYSYTIFDKCGFVPQKRDEEITEYFKELRNNLNELGRSDLLG